MGTISVYELGLIPKSKTKLILFKAGEKDLSTLQLNDNRLLILFQHVGIKTHDELYSEYQRRYLLYQEFH